MGKRINVQLPSGQVVNLYVSNNAKSRAEQARIYSQRYGVQFDPNNLRRYAEKERKVDQARQAQIAAINEQRPDYAKNVKNYAMLSSAARKRLQQINTKPVKQERPDYAKRIKNWDNLSPAIKAKLARQAGYTDLKGDLYLTDRKGTLSTKKAAQSVQRIADQQYNKQRAAAIAAAQADLITRFSEYFKPIRQEVLEREWIALQRKIDYQLESIKTPFEKRIDKIEAHEQAAAIRAEKAKDTAMLLTGTPIQADTTLKFFARKGQDLVRGVLIGAQIGSYGLADMAYGFGLKTYATVEGSIRNPRAGIEEQERVSKKLPGRMYSDTRDFVKGAFSSVEGFGEAAATLYVGSKVLDIGKGKPKGGTTLVREIPKTKAAKIISKAKAKVKEVFTKYNKEMDKVLDPKRTAKRQAEIDAMIKTIDKSNAKARLPESKPTETKVVDLNPKSKNIRKALRKEYTKQARAETKASRKIRKTEEKLLLENIKVSQTSKGNIYKFEGMAADYIRDIIIADKGINSRIATSDSFFKRKSISLKENQIPKSVRSKLVKAIEKRLNRKAIKTRMGMVKAAKQARKATRPNITKYFIEDPGGNILGTAKTFKQFRRAQIKALREFGELPPRKGIGTRAKRNIEKARLGKKGQRRGVTQIIEQVFEKPSEIKRTIDITKTEKPIQRMKAAELKRPYISEIKLTESTRFRPRARFIPLAGASSLVLQTQAMINLQKPGYKETLKPITSQTPTQSLRPAQAAAQQQLPAQTIKLATTESLVYKLLTTAATAVIAEEVLRRSARKSAKGNSSSQRADYSFKQSVYLARQKKRGIYLPDLYAVLTGEKATAKQTAKLVNPQTVFSGIEARPIVG